MEFITCNLCHSKISSFLFEAQDYITGSKHKLVRCENCRLVYVNPRPGMEEISEYYPATYYGKEPFTYERIDAESRFKIIKNMLQPSSRVLDIGCGRGLVLGKCSNMGCEVYGTELSLTSSWYAREVLKLKIFNKHLIDCSFADDYFDLITMYHSLEHLEDPLGNLREIYRVLKPGGILVIEVPRFNSWMSVLFKGNWFHLDVPRHLYHFEDNTLEQLLNAVDLKVIKKKRYAILYDAFGGLQSVLNCCCIKKNLLNDINTKRYSAKDFFVSGTTRDKIELGLSLLGQLILFPLFLMISISMAIFNRGGTLVFVSKKQ